MQRHGGLQPRGSYDTSGPNARLAELVAHLSGCPAPLAVDAVERSLPDDVETTDDRLEVVARAMVLVKREGERLHARRPA